MNITVLDFETYYDREYSLKKLAIPQYVHDPRFHVHGLAICWPDGRSEFATAVSGVLDRLKSAFGQELESTRVACHNAPFDLYILNHKFGLRPRFFIDTQGLANQVLGRREHGEGETLSLKALAERYGLPHKGDLDFMCGVRCPDVMQAANLSSYARGDAEITRGLAERLLPQITRPVVELPILMHTVRLFTERGISVDVAGITEVENQVRERANECLGSAGVEVEHLDGSQFAALLGTALERTGRKVPMKQGKNGLIPAIAKTDLEMQALLEDDDPAVAALAAARLEKKGQEQKLARLATLRAVTDATGGILPPLLHYCGCSTGRFAGGGKFNVQNLGRSGPGSRIRELLIARPGHSLIIGDLAQIEARVTAWLAGQDDILTAFRDQRDLYSEFASSTLHREVRKLCEDATAEQKAEFKSYREVGKQAVLGLGFGMGALKFMNSLRSKPAAAPLFDSGVLSPVICHNIVRDYRSHYRMIKAFWNALEQTARAAANGVYPAVGCLHFDRRGDTTCIHLPSGRALRYANLRLEDTQRCLRYLDEWGQESEFTPDGPALMYGKGTVLYGGKLCENVVQAVARDLLVEAVLRIEARGFTVLFHVHDEVVVEMENRRATEAQQAVEEELCRVPAWAAGLPIDCEVKVVDRYGK